MFSVAPNIVLVPNMTQNAERKHRTQDTNTAPIRPPSSSYQTRNQKVDKVTKNIFFNYYRWLHICEINLSLVHRQQ